MSGVTCDCRSRRGNNLVTPARHLYPIRHTSHGCHRRGSHHRHPTHSHQQHQPSAPGVCYASYLWKLVRFPLNIEYTVRANNMDFISSLPLILAVLRVGSVGWAAAVTCQCQCWWLGPSLLWSHHYYLSPARPACPVSAANTLTPPIHTPPTQLAHTSFTTVTSSIHMIFVGHSDNPSSFFSGLSSIAIAWPLHWADNVGSDRIKCV